MPNFNRGDVLSLTLDYDDVVTITGNASVKITPIGGTAYYTNVTGTQTLGAYKNTSTALVITCDTAGSYTTSNDPSVNPHLLVNAAGTGGQNALTGADVSLGGGIAAGRTLTASATLQLTDANTLITSNHATVAQIYTIPNDATVAWPVLTYITLYQQGAAAASFTNGAGVGAIQGTAPTAGAGVISGVLKVAANTWAYA